MKMQPKHARPFWNKKNILFISLALVFAIGVGVTTAWLSSTDNPVNYSFDGVNVVNAIGGEWFTDSNAAGNFYVQNIGNVNGFIRAKPVAVWWTDGTENNALQVHYKKPVEGTDYTIEYDPEKKWVQGEDGYWYYRFSVAPGKKTADLIERFYKKPDTEPEDGYRIKLTLVSNIIQAEPGGTWQKAWDKKDTPQYRPAKLNETTPGATTETFETSVMSFNIRWSGNGDSSNNFAADSSAERDWWDRENEVRDYILGKSYSPGGLLHEYDIICLQEVSQFAQYFLINGEDGNNNELGKIYGGQFTPFETNYREWNADGPFPIEAIMGSIVIAKKDKYEWLNHDSFWLSNTPDVESDCFGLGYKLKCTISTLRHIETGKVINVVNVHLPYDVGAAGDKARLKSIELIKKRMDRYIVDYTIMAGDFNADKTSSI